MSKMFFLLLLVVSNTSALDYQRKIQLPKLSTKQSINNIRFISKDGKFTYYQRRTGDLLLSTNYKVKTIINGEIGTNYLVVASSARKKLLISKDPYFHTFYGMRKKLDIYATSFGGDKTRFIGKGIKPKLHLDDTWMSYYNPNKRIINFTNLKSSALTFSIKINNNKNPYFNPQVVMPNEDEVYYTDLNNKGIPGLIRFNRRSKKYKTQIKGSSVSEKFDICLNEKHIFLMELGFNQSKRGTVISHSPRTNIDFGKRSIIYESIDNDLGPLICNSNGDFIYFVKNLGSKSIPKYSHEAARLNTKSQNISILSNVQHATQLISMDKRILLPFRGDFLVLLDENGKSNLSFLKMKQQEKKK